MPKFVFTDDVVSIMHFNSDLDGYMDSVNDKNNSMECCYCFQTVKLSAPKDINGVVTHICPNCGKSIVYRSLYLNAPKCKYFEIRPSYNSREFATTAVMHIVLPVVHHEFQECLEKLQKGLQPTRPTNDIKFMINVLTTGTVEIIYAEYFEKIAYSGIAPIAYMKRDAPGFYIYSNLAPFGLGVRTSLIEFNGTNQSREFKRIFLDAKDKLASFLISYFQDKPITDRQILYKCRDFIEKFYKIQLQALVLFKSRDPF